MIKLTEEAAAQIKSSGSDSPLRIAVTQHASHKGFQYLMGFDEQKENDSLYEVRDVKLLVSNDLLDILNGMEIDFVEIEGEDKQFIFKNPNDPHFKSPTE